MGHTFIDHTADVAAELDGTTPGELFASAARALADTITPLEGVRASIPQSVTMEAPTLEDLLVDWLNELLYLFEVRAMLFSQFDVRVQGEDGRWRLDATIGGEPFDPARLPHPAAARGRHARGRHRVRRRADPPGPPQRREPAAGAERRPPAGHSRGVDRHARHPLGLRLPDRRRRGDGLQGG